MRLLILLSILLYTSPVIAEERILDFHSEINIYENADMRVSETILVNAEGRKIRRGIYRDFPIDYKDRLGNRYRVGFDIENILRNGYSENFHTERKSNGIRIYFGQKNKFLKHGQHEYQLRYKTNRQLGFFENHDELYWNVTGTDWEFPINKASTLIHLPRGINAYDADLTAYTGRQGASGKQYTTNVINGSMIKFETTAALPARHGLTIVVGFPKGIVQPPDLQQKINYLIDDNRHLLYAFFGIIALLAYYLFVWNRLGRDPEEGIIIALYHPPHGYSPASMRYIENMGYDNSCFASAIINLAVKGYLTITENKDKEYVLTKTGKEVDMAAGEKALSKELFNKDKSIILKQSNHSRISSALATHEDSLASDYEYKYFMTNTGWVAAGILFTIIVLAIVLFTGQETIGGGETIFMLIWLTPWTLACFAMVKASWNALVAKHYAQAFGSFAFALPFLTAEVFVAYQLVTMTSLSILIILLFACCINWLFYELLKAPTLAGRKLLDKVEGFRRYIELAEKHELDYRHPKGKSPELFEEYLPYALALDVDQAWAEQFADTLGTATTENNHYSPVWYHGRHWNAHNLAGFTHSLGSTFSSAIASSSTAPGSSSGGGGGGFSGGGGGGGGGGGW